MPENDGRDTGAHARGDGLDDNVIRFPRDWFGPIEELAPIGPRAIAASAAAGDPPLVADEHRREPTADDFWGEGSAEAQLLVPAPVTVELESRKHRRLVPVLSRGRAAAVLALAAVLAVVAAAGLPHSGRAGARWKGSLAAAAAVHDRLPGRAQAVVLTSRPDRSRHRTRTVHRPAHAGSGGRVSSGPARAVEVVNHESSPSTSAVVSSSSSSGGTPIATDSRAASTPQAGPVGPGAAFGPGQIG